MRHFLFPFFYWKIKEIYIKSFQVDKKLSQNLAYIIMLYFIDLNNFLRWISLCYIYLDLGMGYANLGTKWSQFSVFLIINILFACCNIFKVNYIKLSCISADWPFIPQWLALKSNCMKCTSIFMTWFSSRWKVQLIKLQLFSFTVV